MQIWHHISFNTLRLPDVFPVIERLGLEFKEIRGLGPQSRHISFDISEDDGRWVRLKPDIEGVLDIVYTVFDQDEVLGAEWVRLIPTFETGFPHPKDTWIPHRPNFEAVCTECGRYLQRSPFQVKEEPNLAGHDFMRLSWTYSLFTTREVLEGLVQSRFGGFDAWELIVAPHKKPSTKVQQIHVLQTAGAGYVDDSSSATVCRVCSTVKHKPHRRGPMTFEAGSLGGRTEDILLTTEWFGDGKGAFQEILVSHRLADHILLNQYKGVTLQPVRLA